MDQYRLHRIPTDFERGTTATIGRTLDQHNDPDEEFLSFVHILSELKIPAANPCVLNAGRVLATSGTLGRGAQYLVDRIYDNQRWPDKLGSSFVRSVVYKRASTRFGAHSSTGTNAAQLEALTREISVLGQLRHEENVIQLLGVAWESINDHDVQPVLVLEYADLGSLADLMLSSPGDDIGFQQKKELCADIAAGMATVHAHGFIWGDCKPENVLVFPDDSRVGGLRAKISDFGTCEPHVKSDTGFRGLSRPWTAPEADPACPEPAQGFDGLVRAEVYAFGMLLWAISMGGHHDEREYWDLKLQDPHLYAMNSPSRPRMTTREIELAKCKPNTHPLFVETVLSSVKEHLQKRPGDMPIASTTDIALVSELLHRCLAYNPSDRPKSMTEVVLHIGLGEFAQRQSDSKLSPFEGLFDHSFLMSSYGSHTKLSPVATSIFRKLEKYAGSRRSGPAYFQSSLCYLTGFGTPTDFTQAADLMTLSAERGHAQANGIVQRLQFIQQLRDQEQSQYHTSASHELLDLHDDIGDDGEAGTAGTEADTDEILLSQALAGSWIAAEDLRDQNPQLFEDKIGATHRRIGLRPMEMGSEDSRACHSAILKGDESALLNLLDHRSVNIDARNANGETALLLAMRRSQPHMANILLERGASLDIPDNSGARPLHWLITLQRDGLEVIRKGVLSTRPDVQSHGTILDSPSWGNILEPGTPLDWAIDVRNLDAIRFLLDELKASASIETKGRTTALHRAFARHDKEICEAILKTHRVMPFDLRGNSPLCYAVGSELVVQRLLFQTLPTDSLSAQLDLFHSVPSADLNYINRLGENAVYYAVKQNDAIQTRELIRWLKDRDISLQAQATSPTGQNKWSALRRAVYSDDPLVFEEICNEIDPDSLIQVFAERSPDGLSLMHELAFCQENVVTQLATTLDRLRKVLQATSSSKMSPEIWQRCRLLLHGKRPQLTPFQMAVLCHNFLLAELWIEKGAEPLDGVDKSRFLGFLIRYQAYSAHELSTWLSFVVSDPVPNALRRFPSPTTIRPAIAYILRNDFDWWDLKRSGGWKKKYFKDPKDDRDPIHDPMISWRPGVLTALESAGFTMDSKISEYGQWRRDLAVKLYGTEGWLDSNQLAFHHRSRHAADFKSFIIGYRKDSQSSHDYGHHFVTALELAFNMVLTSPYPDHATKVFMQVLAIYNGPAFCNFPYFHYYPLGRTRWRNLTRRETLLHQAVRAQNPEIVSELLENGADWEMANVNWHSPLQLAEIISRGGNPDIIRGSFLRRLSPALPLASLDILEDQDDTPASQIKLLIEGHAIDHRRRTLFGRRPRGLVRALREVRWPWSQYDTDDLGFRFLLFYTIVLLLILACIVVPTYITMVAVPHAWMEITAGFGVISNGFEVFALLADCFMDSYANGSNPKKVCTDIHQGSARAFALAMDPMFNYVTPVMDAYIDEWDSCFTGELPPWVHNKSSVSYPVDSEGKGIYIPGCPADFYGMGINSTATRLLNRKRREYVQDGCECKCTQGGTPDRKIKFDS